MVLIAECKETLMNLFESLKTIMSNKMQRYLNDIPQYDKEDYYQTGLITLRDNILRCEGNPGIALHFLSYYVTSVEHAYIHIFREFVMKNDVFVEKKADFWGGLQHVLSKVFSKISR
jgi:hypothetical protein